MEDINNMNNEFAYGDLEKICFRLDFKYFFERSILWQGETRTLYSVIKEWLWEKHKIGLFVFRDKEPNGCYYNCEASIHEIDSRLFVTENFTSPVTAEIEGIKESIEYLYEEHHKTKVL